MELYEYKNYEEYKKIQIEFTRQKMPDNPSWVNTYDIQGIG